MSVQAFICSSCGHRFEPEEATPQRCPKCLRQSGLQPEVLASSTAASGGVSEPSSAMRAITLVLVILAAGTAIWYFTRPAPSMTAKPEAPGTVGGTPVVRAADISAIPAPWNARLDASSSELKSAASSWPAAPAELVAKIASTVPVRDAEMDFEPGAPHACLLYTSDAADE